MLKKLVFGLLLVAGFAATAGEAKAYYPPRGGYYGYYRPSYYYPQPVVRSYVPYAYSNTYVNPYAGTYYYNYGYYARPVVYPVSPYYYGPRVGVGYYSPRVGVRVGF